MATRILTTLVDDLDGGAADETLRFGLDGVNYEIDLSRFNAARFREHLEPFVNAARKTKAAGRKEASSRRPGRNADIRFWAQANGFQVKDRGKIRAAVVAAYEAARN